MKAFLEALILATVVFTSFYSNAAQATESFIVFVDLNNSQNEIDAAVQAAEKNSTPSHHETVIIVPHRTEEQKKIFKNLYDVEAKIDSGKGDIAELTEERGLLIAQVKRFTGPLPLTSDIISRELSDTISKTEPITSLIISGHHLDSTFKGELGTITDLGLGAALIGNSDKVKTIRSFFGMGCYTATVEAVKEMQSFLPNLVEIGGFNPQGYSRFDGHDAPYLRNCLINEHTLLEAFDKKKSQAELDGVIQSTILNYKNAAICVCHICSSALGDIDVNEVMNSCGAEPIGSISSRLKSLWEMMKPASAENRIYCDTSSSPLRELYSDIKTHAHCASVENAYYKDSFSQIIPMAPGLIRMVHFQNVLSNFVRENAKDIDGLKALSKIYNFPMMNLKSPMACVGEGSPKTETDRGTLVRWINSLPEIPGVSRLKQRMLTQLTYLQCVPPDWVNPPDSEIPPAAPPSCCLDEDKETPACIKK